MSSLQSHVPLPHRSHMRLTRSSPSLVLPDLIRSGVAMRSSSLSKALSSSSSTAVPGPPAEPLLPLIVSVEAISPLKELSAHIKAIEVRFRAWMAKQPTHIEAAVSTTVGAVQGGWRSRGGGGGLMGSRTTNGGSPFPMPQPPPNADPQAMPSLKQTQVLILI
jgi:hypothetical protein